jgi:predicted amidophosphoribosyltransferase
VTEIGPTSGKFVWPPKPMSEAEAGPPSDPGYWKHGTRQEGVVELKPRVVVREREATAVVLRARPEDGPWHPWSWIRQIEAVWFGLTRASLAERAADEGWAPDPPALYCSKCGGSVGLHEETAEGCRVCLGKRLPWNRFVRVGEYHGLLREVVHEVKFTAWRRLGADAGRMLGAQLVPLLKGVDREKLMLVPVPSTFRRRMARGIDHTLVLARGVRGVTGGRIVRALARRHRPSQVGLPMTERKRNVAGTMRLRGRTVPAGCTVIVIDDVRTTGATMTEACRALARGLKERERVAGAVWAAVLGVAVERARADTGIGSPMAPEPAGSALVV